jgi:primosomal protein N' (replication factor Y) (superfamily II helicase)
VLGPLPVGDAVRALIRVDAYHGAALAAALKATQAVRSARKDADFVTVRIDPTRIG